MLPFVPAGCVLDPACTGFWSTGRVPADASASVAAEAAAFGTDFGVTAAGSPAVGGGCGGGAVVADAAVACGSCPVLFVVCACGGGLIVTGTCWVLVGVMAFFMRLNIFCS